MTGNRDITRTWSFWLLFLISTLGGCTNSAATPTIPLYVDESLGGGTATSGLLIAVSAATSIFAMPLGGLMADRFGYRIVSMSGVLISASGLALLATAQTLEVAVASRLLFGLGNAAAMSLALTWLITLAAPERRGKALSLFGLSVWVGLALGPQLATLVYGAAGPRATFWVCAALESAVCLLFILLPRPRAAATTAPVPATGRSGRSLLAAFRAVWVPGVAAAAAWCGEGLLLGFLIVHLGGVGVAASGVFGAASVFAVFAASVILARIALAQLPDQIGPLRASAISLVLLSIGLAVLAFARDFPVAAIGAAIMGVGFAPLYPSLTMLAARSLRPSNRAVGLGMFGSFTSIGYAGGALVGGLVIAATSSMWAFVLVAGLQLVALAVVTMFTPDDSSRPHLDSGEPRHPAA